MIIHCKDCVFYSPEWLPGQEGIKVDTYGTCQFWPKKQASEKLPIVREENFCGVGVKKAG